MVKVNNIKMDKNVPIKPINPQDNNSTNTGTQNTVPNTNTTTPTNIQSNTFQKPDPLWKDVAK
jgi:hypothetical protein